VLVRARPEDEYHNPDEAENADLMPNDESRPNAGYDRRKNNEEDRATHHRTNAPHSFGRLDDL
jgi:hypothetical protein